MSVILPAVCRGLLLFVSLIAAASARAQVSDDDPELGPVYVDPGTPGPEIKALYKTLVKRLHPDANGGDRSNEDRLREKATGRQIGDGNSDTHRTLPR